MMRCEIHASAHARIGCFNLTPHARIFGSLVNDFHVGFKK